MVGRPTRPSRRVEAVLGGHNLVFIRLERRNHLAKALPSAHIPWQKTMLAFDAFISDLPFLVACKTELIRPSTLPGSEPPR